ncbi:hypothetical protein [Algoriphagus mannitolivorans]|uniref:hypothetical protein n=1 Tax=Algoriphagus mannitolivorans TaxID=226504 RepID=UPI0003FEDFEE|nr:hypothetical protein [Algoriphagus mannitolivorans]
MKTYTPTHQRAFTLYHFTGTTEESGKNMETKVSGGGGGGATYQGTGGTAPVTITSRTVVHDQVFLINKEGKEKSFQLQDFNLAARKGNQLTVFWGIKSGDQTGEYFAVKNHSTEEEFYRNDLLKKFFIKGWLQGLLMLISSFTLLIGLFGDGGFLWILIGGAGWFWVWKRWNTANREIQAFKADIASFSAE